jgi:hypothetical protein
MEEGDGVMVAIDGGSTSQRSDLHSERDVVSYSFAIVWE